MILDEVGRRILSEPAWFKAVYDQTFACWRQQEEQAPAELASTERVVANVERKIARLVDQIENGLADPEVAGRLEQRRSERRELGKKLEQLQRASHVRTPEPSEAWVREQLHQLHECLHGAQPMAAYALRNLVGGEIVVTEIRREGRERHYLRGRFTIRSASIVYRAAGGVQSGQTEGAEQMEEVVIDFVDPNPLDVKADEAKELYDHGLMSVQIAQRLGWSKSMVTKLLKHWFESRGLTMPDGRSRRSQLVRKHNDPPLYQRISDEVKRLCDEDSLLQEIAEQLNCDRDTVTKAHAYWHESRGLPVPDDRSRRKTLDRKVSRRTDVPAEDPIV